MKLTTDGEQYAKVLFVQKTESITREREEKLGRLRMEPRGGGSQAAIAKVHVDCIESLAKAFAESYVVAYEKSGIILDLEGVKEIIEELQRLINT